MHHLGDLFFLYFCEIVHINNKMKNIAILAGGNSGEYEVSLNSGTNILNNINRSLFTPYFIHVKGTEWSYTDEYKNKYEIDKNDFSLLIDNQKINFDLAFIAIHGNPGENGKMQGYFDMLDIPYTGCDCFCSALTFNKYFCNLAVREIGVPISASLHYYKDDKIDEAEVEKVCGFPCFVKPCNSGSSVGVTKVHNLAQLREAIKDAFQYDDQLLIEKLISGQELACGVATVDGKCKALAVTEIVSKNEFYDYQSKYTDGLHDLVIPANLSQENYNLVMQYSEKIYHHLNCKGVVRVDFIITADGIPYFLEINTIPGQTAMSIIPSQVRYNHMDVQDFYTDMIMDALNKQ